MNKTSDLIETGLTTTIPTWHRVVNELLGKQRFEASDGFKINILKNVAAPLCEQLNFILEKERNQIMSKKLESVPTIRRRALK